MDEDAKEAERRHREGVGRRLREARHLKRIDQSDLAKMVGVTEKTISNAENGVYSAHRWIEKAATVLEVDPTWLWQGETASPDVQRVELLLQRLLIAVEAIRDELRAQALGR